MARLNILKTFYASAIWINFRITIIAERGPQCEYCNRLITTTRDIIIHHTPIELTIDNVYDVTVSLNPKNVKLICFECHNKEHGRFSNNKDKEAYIVYGPPLSGKTAYVNQVLTRGDLVVDMNELFRSLSGLNTYDKPNSLASNVISVYNFLLDQIKTRYGKWGTAYIIGGFADKYKREKLADDLGAELIYCEILKEEAISRIDDDEQRRSMKVEYINYINKWYEEYTI